MARPFVVALLQMTSGRDRQANLATVLKAMEEAAARGADLLATPEMTLLLDRDRESVRARAYHSEDDPDFATLATAARRSGLALLVGSAPFLTENGRLANRSVLFSREGRCVARYDKIHLFDVDLPGGESWRESNSYRAGDRAVLADLDGTRIGLTICYDLRFAALYRTLAQAEAEILTVPAAFTRPTGRAHWHVLLRARAIETGSFVIAPAQTGRHEDGRETYGHSLIVNPWGEILCDAGEAPSLCLAGLDLAEVAEARRRIPSLEHDRPFALASAARDESKRLPK